MHYKGPEDLNNLGQVPAEPFIDENFLTQIEGLHPYRNLFFPNVTHIPVYQQNKEGHCGFYMIHNAKTFVRALLAPDKYT